MDHELRMAGSGQPTQQDLQVAQTARLFVGGLVVTTTKEQLADYFSKFGEILYVEVCGSPNGRSKLFGYITFRDEESLETVLLQPELSIEDKPVRVARAMNEATRKKWHEALVSNRVFLTCIPDETTSYEIGQLVSRFGDVKYVTRMRKNNKNKLFCCVTMESAGQAEFLLRHKILPFKQQLIKLKRFSNKDQRRPTAGNVHSEESSMYGEDDIADELFAHKIGSYNSEQELLSEGYYGPAALTKKQKKKLRIRKAKELEAYLLHQQYLSQFQTSQNFFNSFPAQTMYGADNAKTQYPIVRSSENHIAYRRGTINTLQDVLFQQSPQVCSQLGSLSLQPTASSLSRGPKEFPYLKYSNKRIVMQSSSHDRKNAPCWAVYDISHMKPTQLERFISTSCVPQAFGESQNLKFNLRLE